MSKGELIGRGRTADVHRWEGQPDAGGERVLKLFKDWCPGDWVAAEAAASRAAVAAGAPAPRVHGEVRVDGRAGLVLDRVPGHALIEEVKARPWRAGRAARRLAHVHLAVHAASGAGLPAVKEQLAQAIADVGPLLGDHAGRLRALLEALPEGDALCHWDFHPENVLVDGARETVIDWGTAVRGAPAADVARTLVVLRSPFLPREMPRAVRLPAIGLKRWMARAYLAEYARRARGGAFAASDVQAWVAPVAAARLREGVPDEERWLLDLVRRALARGRAQ